MWTESQDLCLQLHSKMVTLQNGKKSKGENHVVL